MALPKSRSVSLRRASVPMGASCDEPSRSPSLFASGHKGSGAKVAVACRYWLHVELEKKANSASSSQPGDVRVVNVSFEEMLEGGMVDDSFT